MFRGRRRSPTGRAPRSGRCAAPNLPPVAEPQRRLPVAAREPAAVTISQTAPLAPKRSAIRRMVRSVTPAMGARKARPENLSRTDAQSVARPDLAYFFSSIHRAYTICRRVRSCNMTFCRFAQDLTLRRKTTQSGMAVRRTFHPRRRRRARLPRRRRASKAISCPSRGMTVLARTLEALHDAAPEARAEGRHPRRRSRALRRERRGAAPRRAGARCSSPRSAARRGRTASATGSRRWRS